MPKIIAKPEDKFKRFLISNIEYQCSIRGISREEQSVIARCSHTTYNTRRKDPGKFTVDELLNFAKKLKIPIWELLKEETG